MREFRCPGTGGGPPPKVTPVIQLVMDVNAENPSFSGLAGVQSNRELSTGKKNVYELQLRIATCIFTDQLQ